MKDITTSYIEKFLENNKDLSHLKVKLIEAIDLLVKTAKTKKQILTCGNGGSAADSEHIAGELLKAFALKRPINQDMSDMLAEAYGEEGAFITSNLQEGIKCIPLTSFTAYNTAFLNDCNEKLLFAQLVNVLGEKDDVLLAISTSGNSKNVCYAAKVARVKGIKVLALTGDSGGMLKNYADILINVPSSIVYRIQEYHLPIYHLLCLCLESEMFDI